MSKLTKSKGPLLGVCAGLAKSMNISPLVFRIGLPIICLVFWPSIIFIVGGYLILGVALPKEQQGRLEGGDYPDPQQLGSAEVVFCRNCGTKNSREAKFCRSCGKEVTPV
ncbi:MAG: PspC domain-containing protein [Saprospiraceae bacterium]